MKIRTVANGWILTVGYMELVFDKNQSLTLSSLIQQWMQDPARIEDALYKEYGTRVGLQGGLKGVDPEYTSGRVFRRDTADEAPQPGVPLDAQRNRI